MRHLSRGRKLNRHGSHRTAMMRNQASALFKHGRIKTTLTKAKNLQPYVEKLITTAKGGTLHARRLVSKEIHDKDIVRSLMDDIAPSMQDHAGGYTRIYRLGLRRGDSAQEALIELITYEDN
ncbi:MAG: 50S ribosomal protein L17 [Deinococcota bacterium]